ncbi:FtsH protease activity modulator HflK [Buchnera aphidicola]|uniref:FtsH protease activity modulator HflK n=1 Tax=Buchnera aphidicola TaxID=9 RepID=UPI0031B8ADCA
MTWNESEDESGLNPWGEKKNKLQVLKKINQKIKNIFYNSKRFFIFLKKKIIHYKNNIKWCKYIKNKIIIFLVGILLLIFFTGFYIVKETEQGVLSSFGKFHSLVKPGLHWRPILLYNVKLIDTKVIREKILTYLALTSDNKLCNITINVQYRIVNPNSYLLSISNPENNLHQIIDGVLHKVIGSEKNNAILEYDHAKIINKIQKEIERKVKLCDLGITIFNINFLNLSVPDSVIDSFIDISLAKQNRQEYIDIAKKYSDEIIWLAHVKYDDIINQARLYKEYKISTIKGNIIHLLKIFYNYKISKINNIVSVNDNNVQHVNILDIIRHN